MALSKRKPAKKTKTKAAKANKRPIPAGVKSTGLISHTTTKTKGKKKGAFGAFAGKAKKKKKPMGGNVKSFNRRIK